MFFWRLCNFFFLLNLKAGKYRLRKKKCLRQNIADEILKRNLIINPIFIMLFIKTLFENKYALYL